MIYNPILCAGVLGWASAQVIKFILFFMQNAKLNVERLYGSGGMPSSHSSLVCATLISTGRMDGWDSSIFAVMFVISAVVMYDAANVRLEAGKHAKQLNAIMLKLLSPDEAPVDKKDQFKELLGHTPLQVVCGAVLGILIGAFMPL
ncbi:MAG: divergent PAP2 family protein [Oscillospiraceae bacterium]|nr:divergent PAP2 family protein [Oscillospiraceae bacterium]